MNYEKLKYILWLQKFFLYIFRGWKITKIDKGKKKKSLEEKISALIFEVGQFPSGNCRLPWRSLFWQQWYYSIKAKIHNFLIISTKTIRKYFEKCSKNSILTKLVKWCQLRYFNFHAKNNAFQMCKITEILEFSRQNWIWTFW